MLPTENLKIEWNGDSRDVPTPNGLTIEPLAPGHFLVTQPDGTTVEVFEAGGRLSDGGALDGIELTVETDRERIVRERFQMSGGAAGASSGGRTVKAPMPGMVRSIMVSVGDSVEKNTTLLVLEAMKMENNILAGAKGVVQKIHISEGTSVEKNAVLVEIAAEA